MPEIYTGYKNYLNKVLGIQPLDKVLQSTPPPAPVPAPQAEIAPTPDIPAGLGKDISQVTLDDLPKLQAIDKSQTALYQKALSTLPPNSDDFTKATKYYQFHQNRLKTVDDIVAGKSDIKNLTGLPESEFNDNVALTDQIKKSVMPQIQPPSIPMGLDESGAAVKTGIEPIKMTQPIESPVKYAPTAVKDFPITDWTNEQAKNLYEGTKKDLKLLWDIAMIPLAPIGAAIEPIRVGLQGGTMREAGVKSLEQWTKPFSGIAETITGEKTLLQKELEKERQFKRLPEIIQEKTGLPEWASVVLGETGEMIPYFIAPEQYVAGVLKGGDKAKKLLETTAKLTEMAANKGDFTTLQKLGNMMKEARQRATTMQQTISKPIITGEVTAQKLIQGGVEIPKKPPIPEMAKGLKIGQPIIFESKGRRGQIIDGVIEKIEGDNIYIKSSIGKQFGNLEHILSKEKVISKEAEPLFRDFLKSKQMELENLQKKYLTNKTINYAEEKAKINQRKFTDFYAQATGKVNPPIPEIPKGFTTAEELLTSKDNKVKAQFIKDFFEANGLKTDKIVRAKLDDGFYVSHEYAMEHKGYKPAKVIEETATSKTTQAQPYRIKSDFIGDDPMSLDIAVVSARNRAGIKGGRVKLDDFYAQATGKVTPTPTIAPKGVETPSTTAQIGTLRQAETIIPPKPSITATEQGLIEEAKKYKTVEEFVAKRPVVYHGSPTPLKKFSNKKGGVFFTDSMEDASGFAGSPDNVYEGYLNLKKPLVIDAKGAKWDRLNTKYGTSTQEIISNAQKDGYDGVTFNNIVDNIGDTADWGGESTIHYVYKPKDSFLNESQLTDIFNKAHAGETKPISNIVKETPPIKQVGGGEIPPEKPPAPPVGPEMPTPKPKETPVSEPKEITYREIQALNRLPPKVRDKLLNRINELGLNTKEVRTLDEAKAIAAKMDLDREGFLKRLKGKNRSDSELAELGKILDTNADEMLTLEKLNKPEGMDYRTSALLDKRIEFLQKQSDLASEKLYEGATEAGRTMRMLRDMANKTMEPWYWERKAKKILAKNGRKMTPEINKALHEALATKDKEKLAMFMATLHKSSWLDKTIGLWKTGLLSAPPTHIANTLGNLGMAGLESLKNIPAAGLDIIASIKTGNRARILSGKGLVARVKGLYGKTTREKVWGFLKTGRYDTDILSKVDIQSGTRYDNKILQGYSDAVTRTLGAEDIIFRESAMQESLVNQAMVNIRNNDKSTLRHLSDLIGKEKFDKLTAKERIKLLLENPTDKMAVKATEDGALATFQNDNVISTFISSARKGVKSIPIVGPATEAASQVVAPFSRTPTNIALRTVDYSPAGFVKTALGLLDKNNRTQAYLVDNLGRNITGTGIMALGAYLGKKGIVRGSAPSNPSERADFLKEGPDNSIKFGNTWYSINRFSPVGMIVTLGADAQRILNENPEKYVAATKIFFHALKKQTEQTFLKGVSGGLKAINEPERYAESFIENSIASIIPSIIGRVANTIDIKARVPADVLESIQNRIPVLKSKLPKRRDIFGEPIIVAGGMYNLIDPFASVKAEDQPILTEAKRLKVTIGLPGRSIHNIKLDNYEYDIFQKVNGKKLKVRLAELIASPMYQELPKSEQIDLFEKNVRDQRKEVRDELFPMLMISKFKLPEDTNPDIIAGVISEISSNNDFTRLNVKDQGKIVRYHVKMVKENLDLENE